MKLQKQATKNNISPAVARTRQSYQFFETIQLTVRIALLVF